MNAVIRLLGSYNFYSITIRASHIDLQGSVSTELIKKATSQKFVDIGICKINKYVQLQRGNILITLT